MNCELKKTLRIIYMGTPDFAVPTLERLIQEGYNVVAVITMPDKPVGRHQNQLQASPVKECALKHGIPVLQPEKLKDPDFIETLRSYHADLQIVVAFRMLPEVVWNMPRLGTFNLHAALLPQYRGAAPINWAVINGDKETGITTFFLDKDIDTGMIIQQVRVPIHETDNAGDVHDRLMMLGPDLVAETVENILNDNIHPIPQAEIAADTILRPAPKLFRETCQIHWSEHTLESAYNFVRGLSPYPASWSAIKDASGKDNTMKIYATEKKADSSVTMFSPTPETDGKTYLRISLPGGWLYLTEVQIAGKKRMPITDFLRGYCAKDIIFC